MTDLKTALQLPAFITVTLYDGEPAATGDFGTFSIAVDQFADRMEEGEDAQVWQMDFTKGKLVNVTADAHREVISRVRSKYAYAALPEWLEEAA